MIANSDIVAVAQCFAGGSLSQTQTETLSALCQAAQEYWQAQLLPELTQEACRGAFLTACAWTALAGMTAALEAGEPATAFTAGDLSVRPLEPGADARVRSLRAQAQILMVPYTVDNTFAFQEVSG